MNDRVVEQAKAAYRSGDFTAAAQLFSAAKDQGEVAGEVDHLLGNSLMRIGRYAEAAVAYDGALSDRSYGKIGALQTNRGKALMASGDVEGAVEAFQAATLDSSYATAYKAQLGLGGALMKLGRTAEAGAAYRQAAIDGANPAPAGALASLGDCFVALGRPQDAIESYRTALDFAGPRDDARAINAGLGRAYFAADRASEAVDAFNNATSDGIYRLTAEQQAAYDAALSALSAAKSISVTGNGYSEGIDPLDPLGKSGSLMPDPSDTGFFTLTETEMVQQDRREMKVRRKHRHLGLKIFLIVLILLLALVGAGLFFYTKGYGVPSQQAALDGLFAAVSSGDSADGYLSDELDDSAKQIICSSIPADATPKITAMDSSMSTSTAKVEVELSRGGKMNYTVDFVRDGLGWDILNIATDFDVDVKTDEEGAASGDQAADAADAPAASDAASDQA